MKTKRNLICACCGQDAGRWFQHWNRDTGFGVCLRCAEQELKKMGPEYVEQCYGKLNINYGGES